MEIVEYTKIGTVSRLFTYNILSTCVYTSQIPDVDTPVIIISIR